MEIFQFHSSNSWLWRDIICIALQILFLCFIDSKCLDGDHTSILLIWSQQINNTATLLIQTNFQGPLVTALRRLERVFCCCSVCETMKDYKERCLMVWANYVSLQLYCWAILWGYLWHHISYHSNAHKNVH